MARSRQLQTLIKSRKMEKRLPADRDKCRDPRWQNVPGTGDINNFALIYVTNNAEHTEAF
jgi:hypothetical protein